MNNQNVQDQLSTLERLLSPTPTYFRAIQIVAILFGAFSGVMYQLLSVGITLPEWMAALGDRSAIAVEIMAIIVPQLAVDYKAREKKNELENIR